MTRTLLTLTAVAAAALAGCNQEDHTIVAGPPGQENAVNTVGVELPAPIVASKKYRCADNTVVSLDWREKDGQLAGANLRVGDATAPVELKPDAEGKPPYTAVDGSSLTGTKEASSVQLTLPGKGSQTCKA